jgi:hypothetical protein
MEVEMRHWVLASATLTAVCAAHAQEVVTEAAQRYCRVGYADQEALIPACLESLRRSGVGASFPGEQRVLDGRAATAIQNACEARPQNAKRECASAWLNGVPEPAREGALSAYEAAEEARVASLKQQLEALESRLAESEALSKAERACKRRGYEKGTARIGMTKKDNLECGWGHPRDVNRTITARTTREQWVYGGGEYLYFESGRLVAIQD